MLHLYVEDRKNMVWLPVKLLMRNGAPCLGSMGELPKDFTRDDDRVERFTEFCSSLRMSWMVSEIFHD